MKLHKDGNFLFLPFFLLFFKSIISERMKSTIDFFPVIKTRLISVTRNDKDTPEQCCRFELMDCEDAPN